MTFQDNTGALMARVVGGWALGFSVLGALMTGGDVLSRGNIALGATLVGALALSGAAYGWGTVAARRIHHGNIRYFAAHDAVAELASRRALEKRLVRVRQALLAVVLACGAAWLVLIGTYCIGGACDAAFPGHQAWLRAASIGTLAAGALLLPATGLARVHGNESDKLDMVASDFQRRRTDDPLGLKHGRWE